MKKSLFSIVLLLGLSMTAFADPNGGGLFQRGLTPDEEYYGLGYSNIYRNGEPMLPNHGSTENQDAPLGTGIALLAGFGAAYALSKKQQKSNLKN